MPSGLTYKINSGEDMSLRSFALRCVTQLGAGYFATSQGEKEMPIDKAPVLEVSDYHIKNLEKSKKELEYWTKIQNDKESVKRLYDKYCKESKEDHEDCRRQRIEIKGRYQTMLQKVEGWNLPEEYDSLKELMVKQLKDSIDFDCHDDYKFELSNIDDWIKGRIESAKWSIDYHAKELEKEKKHIQEINRYLQGLYDEIDKVEPLKNRSNG